MSRRSGHRFADKDMRQRVTCVPAPYSYRDDPAVPKFADDRPIIIFDGHCVLCSRSAQSVLRHDKRGAYRLLAAQTPLGHALYVHFGLDPDDYESMILIADGVPTFKSEAGIRLVQGLCMPRSVVWALRASALSFC